MIVQRHAITPMPDSPGSRGRRLYCMIGNVSDVNDRFFPAGAFQLDLSRHLSDKPVQPVALLTSPTREIRRNISALDRRSSSALARFNRTPAAQCVASDTSVRPNAAGNKNVSAFPRPGRSRSNTPSWTTRYLEFLVNALWSCASPFGGLAGNGFFLGLCRWTLRPGHTDRP